MSLLSFDVSLHIKDGFDFISRFKLEKEFEKEFGCKIEDFDFTYVTNEMIIKTLLDKREGFWGVKFVSDKQDGCCVISRLSTSIMNNYEIKRRKR